METKTKIRKFRTVNGSRIGRFETYGSRFGPGKVHETFYDRENMRWVIKCVDKQWHRDVVDVDTPVTCKKCKRG